MELVLTYYDSSRTNSRFVAANRHTGIKIQAGAAAYNSIERMIVPALGPEIDTRGQVVGDERKQGKIRGQPILSLGSTDADGRLETAIDARGHSG